MGAGRTALIAGATGLVGRELLRQLQGAPAWRRVQVLLRRPDAAIDALGSKVHPRVVDFAALPAFEDIDDAFIALGTTIKVAGSAAAFRAVDFDAVLAVARAAKAAGATRLAVVSALGADAGSSVFYNRVKGEMEQAVSALGYRVVVFARPSLLVGDRHALGQPERRGEVWAERLLRPVMGLVPRGVRPIRADRVAAALLQTVSTAGDGVHVLSSGRMQQAKA